MIPVGLSLQTTGGTQLIVDQLFNIASSLPPEAFLVIVLIAAMSLSDVVNNAAAAVIMAPLSITVASTLGVSPDPFLMAVAVGASSSFLTPISHQSNTLAWRPGGYKFADYWRVGLPLEIVVVAVSVPVILVVWPLNP